MSRAGHGAGIYSLVARLGYHSFDCFVTTAPIIFTKDRGWYDSKEFNIFSSLWCQLRWPCGGGICSAQRLRERLCRRNIFRERWHQLAIAGRAYNGSEPCRRLPIFPLRFKQLYSLLCCSCLINPDKEGSSCNH